MEAKATSLLWRMHMPMGMVRVDLQHFVSVATGIFMMTSSPTQPALTRSRKSIVTDVLDRTVLPNMSHYVVLPLLAGENWFG